jgi:hypothetical protein
MTPEEIQRTMEFILQQQAKTEANLGMMETRLDKTNAMLDKTNATLDRMAEDNARQFQASSARMDRMAEENARQFQASSARMDRLERNLTRMARLGMRWRSENKRWQEQHEKAMAAFDIKMAEIGDKLNGLIAVVEGWRHEPPNRPQ